MQISDLQKHHRENVESTCANLMDHLSSKIHQNTAMPPTDRISLA
jgi:hypothetical protein